MSRPSWDEWALGLAAAVAARGSCRRRRVGCVLLGPRNDVVSVGYNGAPAGRPHCQHDGTETRCTTAIHAERNAIAYAAREGRATDGATLYVTHAPCLDCATVIQPAGIVRVVYAEPYGPPSGVLWLMDNGVQVQRLAEATEAAA